MRPNPVFESYRSFRPGGALASLLDGTKAPGNQEIFVCSRAPTMEVVVMDYLETYNLPVRVGFCCLQLMTEK